MGSCAAPSAKGDDKFITTDYLQQCLAFLECTVSGLPDSQFVSQHLRGRLSDRKPNRINQKSYQARF
ncbi:hypothetical protein CWN48_18840 [Klebsiella pneumoniae]|nr:hypothetical protein CWN48_18840 [Klebsiella pneumoniae]